MVTSRERVRMALNHEEPDRVPLDLGGSAVTGMHATAVYALRQALNLDPPGTPVKVIEPYQMLGIVEDDLMDALGVDVAPLEGPDTMFGFPKADWKPFTFRDGTPLLVPGGFNTEPEEDGALLQYPEGDRSAPASGRMPAIGFYHDSIIRQPPVDDDNLSVEDNLEEFGPINDATLEHFAREAERIHRDSDRAVLANFGGTAFGDIALVPAPWLKHPKGIRDIEEWYISLHTRPDHLKKIFTRQAEIALDNLARIHDAVGDRADAVFITGTDFGMQGGPFLSRDAYRDLFAPFHRRVNDWVHDRTSWKTFIHSCGSVISLVDLFIEAGFDILNPVQCSAAGMDPETLKAEYGKRITFWGGGVDTQQTLPFGTADAVRAEAAERIRIFAPGGGFVFNTVHNVQPGTPVENLLALYETVRG